ncbi:hypothetical protein DYBT9275_04679 [Dyadobacter sp. CECT 9275]|uniref:Signal transduction histidine kinase internal region domain-containing protein n=1 Tax=Dyadobacter helix TaxID=2822344 RepID=A0A916JFQ7_9BACT|nr:sensor histidine kinase [Dyadobacter sp. CECT 9275]CAG5010273.1 hypothetical protein DYBT9275_04679 [Dyadobacter sp. CECT 9275]
MFRIRNTWIFHLAGWLLFMSLPLTVMSREPDALVNFRILTSPWFWLFVAVYAVIFYGNTFLLLPYCFRKRRYEVYCLAFVTLFGLMFYLQPFEKLIFDKFHPRNAMEEQTDSHIPPPPTGNAEFSGRFPERPMPHPHESRPGVDFVSLVLFLIVWVAALTIKISERWALSEKQVILSEAEKAQAELSFFKAQINPHFLFNTLNNIYSMAVSKDELTAPSILKLSQLMRYITEEATENFVALEDEIASLQNYIDLQKLRLNARTKVEFIMTGSMAGKKIAPLIFMTFVENAFKYGVSGNRETVIKVRIENKTGEIYFFCQNTVFNRQMDPERAGIGIANTRKRLDYHYPGKYSLLLDENDNLFTVQLHLII